MNGLAAVAESTANAISAMRNVALEKRITGSAKRMENWVYGN